MYTQEISLFQRSEKSIWTDPYISKNMLKAHLDDSNDGASRNKITREKTIRWIDSEIRSNAKILDLGCGPGLYAQELAKLGHTVKGIDFNSESIEYAKAHNQFERVEYDLGNYIDNPIEGQYDLIMMVYCDFGALTPDEQKILLKKINSALAQDGIFIFDVFGEGLKNTKKEIKSWSISKGNDFWNIEPYFLLEEIKHFEDSHAIGSRYFVIEQDRGQVSEYITWDQYYTDKVITDLLTENSFSIQKINPDLVVDSNFTSGDVKFIVSKKMVQ